MIRAIHTYHLGNSYVSFEETIRIIHSKHRYGAGNQPASLPLRNGVLLLKSIERTAIETVRADTTLVQPNSTDDSFQL